MDQLAVVLFWLLLGLALVQIAVGLLFLAALSRFRRKLLPDHSCPPAAVILCLRGPDPFLQRCLDAVLDQDYPHFQLRVVIDHARDPAREIVDRAISRRSAPNAVVQELTNRRTTCSLKCSSLVQAIQSCDESIEFVAQLDADTIPHRSWLRELATALAPAEIGAASGNRWYMPEPATFGALVRYAWNAAAVVQMYLNHYTWGGSLGIKMHVIRETRLLEHFSRAFCEDTMVFRFLRAHGWRVAFVPSLMMINRETCDLPGFRRWMQRQLLTSRLYHPRWPAVAAHGFGTTLVLAFGLLLLVVAIGSANLSAARTVAAGLLLYELSMILMLLPMEHSVRRIAASRGEPTQWMHFLTAVKLLVAVPTTQVIYPWALAGAMLMRTVEWRGVSYQISGPWDIRMGEYRPFQTADADQVAPLSL